MDTDNPLLRTTQMRLAHILAYVALFTACGRSGSRLTDSARTAAADKVPFLAIGPVDSIVLQRTRCYGACPPYRLRLSRTGAIQFVSLARVDSGRIEAAQIPEETVKELLNAVQDVDVVSAMKSALRSDSRQACGSLGGAARREASLWFVCVLELPSQVRRRKGDVEEEIELIAALARRDLEPVAGTAASAHVQCLEPDAPQAYRA